MFHWNVRSLDLALLTVRSLALDLLNASLDGTGRSWSVAAGALAFARLSKPEETSYLPGACKKCGQGALDPPGSRVLHVVASLLNAY